ncbi:MAG: BamA/TamA family outer membrane protein [bacterium]
MRMLLISLAAITCLAASHPAAEGRAETEPREIEPEAGAFTQAADEASERSPFRSEENLLRKVLHAPSYLLIPFKEPVKRFLIFAERIALVDRVLDVLYFNDEQTAGWLPNASFGGKTGFALGGNVFHHDLFRRGKEVSFSFLGGPETIEVELAVLDPAVLETPFVAQFDFLYQEINDQDVFLSLRDGAFTTGQGVGPDDERNYDLDQATGSLDVGYRLTPTWRLGAVFRYAAVRAGGSGDRPAPRELEGMSDDYIRYVGTEGYIYLDSRNSAFRATRGWVADLRGGAVGNVRGEDEAGRDLRFFRYSMELQRYQQLFAFLRTLVVRALVIRTEPLHRGDGVPFYWQPALDEDTGLRGYTRGRFRDRGAVLFNLEYRYPVWDTWEGTVFLDEGQVFHQYGDIRWEAFRWSAGVGAQFSTRSRFLLRTQLAVSDEGVVGLIKLSQAF